MSWEVSRLTQSGVPGLRLLREGPGTARHKSLKVPQAS